MSTRKRGRSPAQPDDDDERYESLLHVCMSDLIDCRGFDSHDPDYDPSNGDPSVDEQSDVDMPDSSSALDPKTTQINQVLPIRLFVTHRIMIIYFLGFAERSS